MPSRAEYGNAKVGALDDGDCPICNNKGYIISERHGALFTRECECMAKRRTLKRIRRSGLADQLKEYTFDAYKTPTDWHKRFKTIAKEFLNEQGKWFYIGGTSGSGKTHLCTAIVGELISGGKEAGYLQWRSDIPRLKALVNERGEYEERMRDYATIPVLYIDDFLKGNITEADINIAYELINARYINRNGVTIISSERDLEGVLYVDEAVGGRIAERSRGYALKAPDFNWRLKGGT